MSRICSLHVLTAVATSLLLAIGVVANAAPADGLTPRLPAASPDLYTLAPDTTIERVVVKFHEGSRVRLRGGALVPLARSARDRADLARAGVTPGQVVADAAEAQQIVTAHGRAGQLRRLFATAEAELARQRADGEAAGGEQLADLDLYCEVPVPQGTAFVEVEAMLDQLNRLPSVEVAYAEVPAEPASFRVMAAASTTPNFQSQQGYLNAAPGGIDALYAWTKSGGRGNNTKIVDVEWAWRLTHEDFPAVFFQGGTQSTSLLHRNHGTAVLGVLVGKNNGFGVTGIAHNAQIGVQSTHNIPPASAITSASTAVGSGGIVLVEMQRDHTPSTSCTCSARCGVLPVEYLQADFDAIKNAVANNRTVVEAAGNGEQNLNHPSYGGLFFRTIRDSGAIMVAARLSSSGFAACLTNYGYRIDANSWGENVVTTGKGDLQWASNEDQWYTATFDGTSSASPIVTGAAASLQGIAKTSLFKTLTPADLRNRVSSSGSWEWNEPKFIGPQPNLRTTVDQLINGNRVPVANTDFLSTPKNTRLPIFFNTLLANDTDADGDSLSLQWYDFVGAKGGTTTCCHAGGFNYDPPLNFTGTDSLTYRVKDARGLESIGKIYITVQ